MNGSASLPRVAHVPMALAVQGSTLHKVVSRLADSYERVGGSSTVVLSDNRGVDLPSVDSIYVDYTENCPREWFTRRELSVDIAAGLVAHDRPFYGRMYDPAIRALATERPGIILLYEGHYASASLPRWKALRANSQLCLYVHNPLSRTYGRRELDRLLGHCDRVIFCADHLRRDVERRLGRSDDRFEVVHNGVDKIFFSPTEREPPSDFTVVFAGLLAPHKGPHLVLEAVHRAYPRIRRPVHLKIIGGSVYGANAPVNAYERTLHRRSDEMEVAVDFVPWLKAADLAAELQQASVVCLPSLWPEGLPLTALEAMAAGVPIVCSDAPGLVEATGDVALVARRADVGLLSDALVRLATDNAEWTRRSSIARARAATFTWDKAARRLAQTAVTAGDVS